MQAAGMHCLYPLTELAVMGFVGVAPLLAKFHRLYRQAREFLKSERPDGVVLVDFPGFNWWIAKAARDADVPVFFYCPPQMWAWAGWRIHKMRRLVDCVLSVLPFEAEWYRDRGMDVEYVGHPFFDEVAEHPLDPHAVAAIRDTAPFQVGVLPGSRKQEVNRNFPLMLEMIENLSQQYPHVRFPVACYKEWHRIRCAELMTEHGKQLPIDLHVGETPEVIEASDCCLIVSGSVSLELLARRTPAVVMYKAGWLTYWIARTMGTCDYISLPNLIANRPLMPEFPFHKPSKTLMSRMEGILAHWIAKPDSLDTARRDLTTLADGIVEAGGVSRAAEVLCQRLSVSRPVQATPLRKAA